MKLSVFLKNKGILNWLSIVLAILFIFITIYKLVGNFYYAFGDSGWLLNPVYLDRLFCWSNYNLGFFYSPNDLLPLNLFYNIFHLFGLKNNFFQFFYYSIFYVLSFLSYVFLIRKVLDKNNSKIISVITALFYIFNVFNIVGPFNERLFPIFVCLPLIFYCFYKLLHIQERKYIFYIAILSLFYSGSNLNIPTTSIVYLILLSYLIYFLLTEKLNKNDCFKLIKNLFLLLIFFLLINLWWLSIMIPSMLEISQIGAAVNTFRATGSGYFFDHFRLIGSWAWYMAHYLSLYFPFSLNYYKPFLLFTSYAITFFSLSVILVLKNSMFFSIKDKRLYLYFFILFLAGIFLANGTKNEMGVVYETIYNSNSLLWMFREPWAKFTPILIFSLPFLFYGMLNYLSYRINNRKIFYSICFLVFLFNVINAYPYFSGEAVWKKWNGSMRTGLVKIPEYYDDIRGYLDKNNLKDDVILVFPYNFMYMAFNWPYGLFTIENPAVLLLDNPVLESTSLPMYNGDVIINKIFNNFNSENLVLQKYISLINARYILQENDADWRYSDNKMLPPSQSNKVIIDQKLKKVADFGQFTADYLRQIPNDEPGKSKNDELYKELLDKPALTLYKIDDKNFLPQFFTPQTIYTTTSSVDNIFDIVSKSDFQVRSAVFFQAQNQNNSVIFERIKNLSINKIKSPLPTLEFKKINLTKYRVRIHGAAGEFPLVFSQSFHNGWNIYNTSLTKRPVNKNVPAGNYKIFGNDEAKATKDELNKYIVQNFISDLGDGKEKNINHYKWENNQKEIDFIEKYNIDYVSKNFQGTIQNKNLPNGSFFETLFKKSIPTQMMVNGYANSWLLDASKICEQNSACIQNADGSYDFELVVEFWPQRIYFCGLFISGFSLVGILVYLLYNRYKFKQH